MDIDHYVELYAEDTLFTNKRLKVHGPVSEGLERIIKQTPIWDGENNRSVAYNRNTEQIEYRVGAPVFLGNIARHDLTDWHKRLDEKISQADENVALSATRALQFYEPKQKAFDVDWSRTRIKGIVVTTLLTLVLIGSYYGTRAITDEDRELQDMYAVESPTRTIKQNPPTRTPMSESFLGSEAELGTHISPTSQPTATVASTSNTTPSPTVMPPTVTIYKGFTRHDVQLDYENLAAHLGLVDNGKYEFITSNGLLEIIISTESEASTPIVSYDVRPLQDQQYDPAELPDDIHGIYDPLQDSLTLIIQKGSYPINAIRSIMGAQRGDVGATQQAIDIWNAYKNDIGVEGRQHFSIHETFTLSNFKARAENITHSEINWDDDSVVTPYNS